MKRWEDFNKRFGLNEKAEEQAFRIALKIVNSKYGLQLDDDIEGEVISEYKVLLDWLNEDVGVGAK